MQPDSQVYFLLAPSVGMVKIGRSIDIERRLQEIRLICPVPLDLLGYVPGSWDVETQYHRDWSSLRRHGEWFEAAPTLLAKLQSDVIVAAWNRACPEAREIARDQIDAPIFDRTRAGAA